MQCVQAITNYVQTLWEQVKNFVISTHIGKFCLRRANENRANRMCHEREPNVRKSMRRENQQAQSFRWVRQRCGMMPCKRELQMLCANARTHWEFYFVCFGTSERGSDGEWRMVDGPVRQRQENVVRKKMLQRKITCSNACCVVRIVNRRCLCEE